MAELPRTDFPLLLFAETGPFYHLREDLPPQQAKTIDGIRYSGDSFSLAYHRLNATAEAMVGVSDPADRPDLYVGMFLDAWSMVDSAMRLRRLILAMPGLKRTPPVQLMLRHLAPYEELRNSIQHLDTEIINRLEARESAWGSLSWLRVINPEMTEIHVFVMVPGHMRNQEAPAMQPWGFYHHWIDGFELSAFGASVKLSDTYWRLRDFAPGMEQGLADQFEGHTTLPSDLFLTMELVAPPGKLPEGEARE